MSARSSGSISVQIIAEKLGGGGHFTKAATVLEGIKISEAERKLIEVLDSSLSEARNDALANRTGEED